MTRWIPFSLPLAGLLLLGFTAPAATIHVFAAASLTDALMEVASDYTNHSTDKLVFNFGGSSMLARQIEEGAPADVFFSADDAQMDALEKKGLILIETRRSRLSNSLVIVVAVDASVKINSAKDLADPRVRRIALADPQSVPAGVYSRKYLQSQDLWPMIASKVVPTENVRAALAAVESGNVEAGMVYKTDASISKRIRIACDIPASEGPPIHYPVAVVKESKQVDSARRFVDYLNAPETDRVFARHGFILLDRSK